MSFFLCYSLTSIQTVRLEYVKFRTTKLHIYVKILIIVALISSAWTRIARQKTMLVQECNARIRKHRDGPRCPSSVTSIPIIGIIMEVSASKHFNCC